MTKFANIETRKKEPRFKPFPTCESHPDSDERSDAWDEWYKDTASKLNGAELDTLVALMRSGPLWDGDVPSKSARDTLLDLELCSKIIVSGRAMPSVCAQYVKPPPLLPEEEIKKGYEWGYQASSYHGAYVFQELLKSGRIKP